MLHFKIKLHIFFLILVVAVRVLANCQTNVLSDNLKSLGNFIGK